MIYYFSGASHQHLKLKYNVDQLFSQYHERNAIRKLIEYKKSHPEHTGKLMVDSGSFTAYTKGVYIDIDDYLKFIEEVGDYVDVFVAVDDVPDPANMDFSKADTTWNNYLYMVERISEKNRDKLIPVFHYGEDFKHLKRFLEYRHPDGKPIDYIGLAISLEGTTNIRIKWENTCRQIIKESSNPNVKTHAFGVGVKSVLDCIDCTSTDATSWVKAAAYGMIRINDKPIYISDVSKESLTGKHYTERSKGLQESVEKVIKDRGFTIEQLETDSTARAEFNLIDTLDWVSKLRNKKSTIAPVDLGW